MNDFRPLYILDVFAEKKYAGNQLAVVRNAKGLSDHDMQDIAREMHFSETTFLVSDQPRTNNDYDVRIFTPESELPFAGHPTIGTAYLIQQELIRKHVEKIILNEKIGPIQVSFEYGHGDRPEKCWMQQNEPIFGETFDRNVVAKMLNISPSDIDSRFPVESVSTGVPALIVPLKTLAAVRRSRPNGDYYFENLKKFKAPLTVVFSPETYSTDNQLNVRVFTDFIGIPEDPATGSGNGCLTAYLMKHGYFGPIVDVKVEQGYEIKRPSLLYLKGEMKGDSIDVRVGGHVILTVKGELV